MLAPLPGVHAQDAPPLTLDSARAAARRASFEVHAAREAVAAARGRERQAGAWANPTIGWSREQTSGGSSTNAQDIVALEQPLDIGGARPARAEAARLRREAAEARLALAEAEIDYAATRAYALAIAAGRRAQLATRAAEVFGQAQRTSEERLAAGDVSGYAARRTRLEAARYAALRAESALESRSARLALGALVATSAGEVRSVSAVLADSLPPAAEPPPADTLRALALGRRAELRALQLEARAAAAEARLAARERVPVPVLQGGIKTEEPAGGDERLSGFVAGVSLPLPLFDRRRGAVEAAGAEARRAEAAAEGLGRRIAREVDEARDALVAVREQLALLAPHLGAEAERALRSAQVAFAEGEIGLVEWLDAVRAWQEAESSYATLRAEALVRQAALERATGAVRGGNGGTSGAGAPGNGR